MIVGAPPSMPATTTLDCSVTVALSASWYVALACTEIEPPADDAASAAPQPSSRLAAAPSRRARSRDTGFMARGKGRGRVVAFRA